MYGRSRKATSAETQISETILYCKIQSLLIIFLLNFALAVGWEEVGGGVSLVIWFGSYSMNVYMRFTLYDSSVFILATSTNSNFNFHIVA